MSSPIPLQEHGTSGLSFPWAFEAKEDGSSTNMHMGGDGVAVSERMWINWGDLQEAVVALLGYSWRDVGSAWDHVASYAPGQVVNVAGQPYVCTAFNTDAEPPNDSYWKPGSILRRKLPWQWPCWNQMWVRNITDIHGWRMVGTNQDDDDAPDFSTVGGSPGSLYALNQGPWTEYERALLTIQFWRPPYYVRTDDNILDADGVPQEWLRYVEKKRSAAQQILTREGSQGVWSGSPSNAGVGGYANGLPGTVGQVVGHTKLTCTWYEIPEASILQFAQDAAPNGQATNLTYTSTETVNPITGYVNPGGLVSPITSCVNTPIGGAQAPPTMLLTGCTVGQGNTTVTCSSTAGLHYQGEQAMDGTLYDGDAVTGPGIPTGATIASVLSDTQFVMTLPGYSAGTFDLIVVSDFDVGLRMFGALMGTLRFDHWELRERPLQLPPYLMQIPLFAQNEALSQVQYDVVLHFDLFDPPRVSIAGTNFVVGSARGHNLMPYSGNGKWYPMNFKLGADLSTNPPYLTPFDYADLSDLFMPR